MAIKRKRISKKTAAAGVPRPLTSGEAQARRDRVFIEGLFVFLGGGFGALIGKAVAENPRAFSDAMQGVFQQIAQHPEIFGGIPGMPGAPPGGPAAGTPMSPEEFLEHMRKHGEYAGAGAPPPVPGEPVVTTPPRRGKGRARKKATNSKGDHAAALHGETPSAMG